MTATEGFRHTLTHDSHGHALPQPIEIDIRAQTGVLALVHSDAQGELVTVHLEVDAAAGGHLVLRAWDGAAPDGEPVVTRTLDRAAPAQERT